MDKLELGVQLHFMLNALDVKRFHTEQMHVHQTLAHHSARMCAMVISIYSPEIPPAALLMCCITHDMPEYVTGDIPAPAKWNYPELDKVLKDIEGKVFETYQIRDPDFLLTPEEHSMLKLVDGLDLMFFCMEAVVMGNQGAQTIVNNIAAHLAQTYPQMPVDSRYKDRLEELLPI